MGARETQADRARRRSERLADQFATEIREARLNLGKSQQDAARDASLGRSEWSRIESGARRRVPLEVASLMASAVGLDLVTSYYAADRVLQDQAHIELTKDSCALLGPDWGWRHEVPIGLPPDQRAWDAVGVHRVTGLSIRMEVETRLRNAQEKLRRIEAKRVADGEPRLVLALRASTFNREAVRVAAPILESMFPASPRAALAKLRVGEDPGADLMLLVGW